MKRSFLEQTWDSILSRDATKIREMFTSLDVESQKVVIAHLHKMVTEEGWHPEQVKSASMALKAIEGK